MTKSTVNLSDLLPGEGRRGVKTGLPRLNDTKLSGTAIVDRVLAAKTGRVEVTASQIVAVGRELLAAHAEATGTTVVASDDELLNLLVTNMSAAARAAAHKRGHSLKVDTKGTVKSTGERKVVVAVKG
jgi:hypothetical protein